MSFYQNVFNVEFRGSYPLGDRQYNDTYVCRSNAGRSDAEVAVWKEPTYDLSGNDAEGDAKSNLHIYYAIDPDFKAWALLSIDISAGAASAAAVTAQEIVIALEANAIFSSLFVASVSKFNSGKDRLMIRQKKPTTSMHFYIDNGRAESALGFNARAGIYELPSYFDHYTIANRWTYNRPNSILIKMDTTNVVHQGLINAAVDERGNSLGYAYGSEQADWQLLDGSCGIFSSKKITVDGSNRITQIIEFSTGAKAGSFAKKTIYAYTSANTNPDKIMEIPYILQSGDLITP